MCAYRWELTAYGVLENKQYHLRWLLVEQDVLYAVRADNPQGQVRFLAVGPKKNLTTYKIVVILHKLAIVLAT